MVQIAGMFFIAMLVKRLGKRNIFSLGLVLDIIGMLVLNFSGGSIGLIIVSALSAAWEKHACRGHHVGHGIRYH